MKFKYIKRTTEEVEADLELPIYLYFQDELGYDEVVKVTDGKKITVKYELFGINILVETRFSFEALNFDRFLTTEEHFNQVYTEALEYISESILCKKS